MKLLIIEDSTEIVDIVAQTIDLRWPEASLLSTVLGQTGIELAEKEHPDLIILDLGLPDINGFEVLRRIRRFSDVPVVILTVRGDEVDKIRGLELGADDYIVKPFSTGEFLARLKAALRHRQTPVATTGVVEKPFIRESLRIDFHTREVIIDSKSIKLSPSEYELLYELVMNEGRVVSKQMLLEKVWGDKAASDTEYVDVYIKRLKETLEKEPGHPVQILSEGEIGYKLIG